MTEESGLVSFWGESFLYSAQQLDRKWGPASPLSSGYNDFREKEGDHM
jgi:hypothetical protein